MLVPGCVSVTILSNVFATLKKLGVAMDKSNIDVSSLPEMVQSSVQNLAQLLLELAGENLQALAVFGAIVSGDFDPKHMSVRSVAIFEKMDLALLNKLRSHGPRLGRQRLQAPLFMTPSYIEQSRDSFPVELLEIQCFHIMVLGQDCFESLEFSRSDVRLQCERELKSNLITLRQGLLSAYKDTFLGPLLVGAMEQIIRVLRALLWLKELEVPSDAAAVVLAVESLLDWKLAGLKNCLAESSKGSFKQFEQVYRDIESLSNYVNEISI